MTAAVPDVVDLTGGRALITGADQPIGAAVATALAGAGVRPALIGTEVAALRDLAGSTGGAAWVPDAEEPAALARVVGEIATDFGQVDVVVVGPVVEPDLRGTVALVRAALPGLVAKGRGHIVIVGAAPLAGGAPGAGADDGNDTLAAATALAGLAGLAGALRAEVVGTGVKVTLVRVTTSVPELRVKLPRRIRRPGWLGAGGRRRVDGGDVGGTSASGASGASGAAVGPAEVAAAVLDSLLHGRSEVTVPAWLGLAPRLQAVAPSAWAALVGRRHRR